MTITLGALTIKSDMYLSGLENASLVSVEQLRTIEGYSVVRAKATPGGRSLTLGTQDKGGSIQGIWCYDEIQQIKALEAAASPVTLDYRGTTYQVIITGCNFTPFLQFELEGPSKSYTGTISMIEV